MCSRLHFKKKLLIYLSVFINNQHCKGSSIGKKQENSDKTALIHKSISLTFENVVLILLHAGINLRNFHNCTKQRKSPIFVAK